MNIALDRDVEEFLQEQVEGGACASASKLVNDVLRSIREYQQKPLEISTELEAWLLQAADQPVTPLTKGDFEGIRGRILQRTRSATA